MSFNTFVRELSKGIEGLIVAYDNAPEQSGCILYLQQQPCTIFVAADVIVGCKDEAIQALRAKIRHLDASEPHLSLVLENGTVRFHKTHKPGTKTTRAKRDKPSAS